MECDENKFKPDSNRAVLYRQVLEQSDICDVTIQVGEWKKKFHWCVLVISPYFESLRRNNHIEKQTGIIKLNVASQVSTERVILSLYGKKLKLTTDNIWEILKLSDLLRMSYLKSSCVRYIQNITITTDNCIQLIELSSVYSFNLPNCLGYIRAHLNDVLQRKEAVNFSKEFVIALFTDPQLSYASSKVQFSYLVNWSKHWQKDEIEFQEVFNCIDLDAMDNEFLKEYVFQYPQVPKGCKSRRECEKSPLSSEEHRVLIFSNSLQQNRMAVFDIEKEKWCGIETNLPTKRKKYKIFTETISGIRHWTLPEMYRVNTDDSSCSVCPQNLQSKEVAVIDITVEKESESISCFFIDGDIFAGVTNKTVQTIKPFNKYKDWHIASGYSSYGGHENLSQEPVRYSTFSYGYLEIPATTVYPVVSIRGTEIASCCVNYQNRAGLLSVKQNTLYIYDMANCKLDIIQLGQYIDLRYRHININTKFVPSDSGFILYNNKQALAKTLL